MTEPKPINVIAKAYVLARAELAEAKNKADDLGKIVSKLKETLFNEFQETGIDQIRIIGKTLSPGFDMFASVLAGNQKGMVAACRDLDLDELIDTKCSTPKIKSRIKEWTKSPRLEDCVLPPEIMALVEQSKEEKLDVREWLEDGGHAEKAPESVLGLASTNKEVDEWVNDELKGVPKRIRELVSIHFEPRINMCKSSR